jgi:AcrR family transcriptional regulator
MIKSRSLSGDSSTRILDTASRLFYEQGYHATGINQIIAEAEVAKASFYHHFHSKEALCIAYLQKRHHDWFSWLKQTVDQFDTPQERLLGLFTFLEKWLPESRFRGCAFLNIAPEFPADDHEIRRIVETHKQSLWNYIKQLLEKLALGVDEADLDLRTDLIYLLFEGVISEGQVYQSTRLIKSAREATSRLIQ